MWLYHSIMHPEDADGNANSVDPDQISDLGLHCLPRLFCPKTLDHCASHNTILGRDHKDTEQTVQICGLILAFVVQRLISCSRKLQSQTLQLLPWSKHTLLANSIE